MFRLVFTAPASDTVPAFLQEIFFRRLEGWTVYCGRVDRSRSDAELLFPSTFSSSTSSELAAFVSSPISGLTVSPTQSFR